MIREQKKIVVIGATSAIAERCARLWATRSPIDLILVGRDAAKLERVAADLRVRAPASRIECRTADFDDPKKVKLLAEDLDRNGAIDVVLIAHGFLPDQKQCQDDLTACSEALRVNGISPVLFAEAFVGCLEKSGGGTVAIISSVAGERGRKSNYAYGAAKGLVTRYAQGLQHRLAGTGVKVVLIKPGPTDTPMTAALKNRGARLASAGSVAQRIVSAIDRGESVVYAPAKWALIMQVVRHMPAFVFNKLNL